MKRFSCFCDVYNSIIAFTTPNSTLDIGLFITELFRSPIFSVYLSYDLKKIYHEAFLNFIWKL